MPATVRDIAKAAGVSAATVSLVLNGKAGISEETRERVLSTASDLGYTAKGVRARKMRSRTLRFLKIAKHGHTVNRDHNTFIADYIDGMSQEAVRRGYKLEVVNFEGEPIEEIIDSLDSSLGGVIVLGTELDAADIELFGRVEAPLVFIDTFYDRIDANFVNMNNKDAVDKIISHFIEMGFSRIGFVSSHVETVNFQLRTEAFIEGMTAHGLDVNPADMVVVDSTHDGAYRDMADWLATGPALPECFFCTNDIITYGCIRALREFGFEIPRDVSIVGFDNLPMSSAMTPPLTTIDVSKKQIGYLAIGILDDLVRSSEPWPPVKVLVGAQLIVRESVAAKAT
ncbi:MAG: helix-turn-helix family protein [Caulobacteraceae bacterium]|nr:helix-turn-helix family protein [Caulobacteraceae bacterium]